MQTHTHRQRPLFLCWSHKYPLAHTEHAALSGLLLFWPICFENITWAPYDDSILGLVLERDTWLSQQQTGRYTCMINKYSRHIWLNSVAFCSLCNASHGCRVTTRVKQGQRWLLFWRGTWTAVWSTSVTAAPCSHHAVAPSIVVLVGLHVGSAVLRCQSVLTGRDWDDLISWDFIFAKGKSNWLRSSRIITCTVLYMLLLAHFMKRP